MKKWLAMLLVLVLILSMMALAGCDDKKNDDKTADESGETTVATTLPSGDGSGATVTTTVPVTQEATVIGAWKAEMGDLSDVLTVGLSNGSEQLGPVPLYGYYEFLADGTFKVYTKEEELQQAINAAMPKVVDIYTAVLDEPNDDLGMTFRELMEVEGYDSVEAMVNDNLELFRAFYLVDYNGTYTVGDTIITLTDEYGDAKVCTYVLTATTLTMTAGWEKLVLTKI